MASGMYRTPALTATGTNSRHAAIKPPLSVTIAKCKYKARIIVLVMTIMDSTFSRLLPGSSYSFFIRFCHALVHRNHHPTNIREQHKRS
jgi:hypothetical protein